MADNFERPRFGIIIEISGAYSMEEALSYLKKLSEISKDGEALDLPDYMEQKVKAWRE